jgi:protease PrsW
MSNIAAGVGGHAHAAPAQSTRKTRQWLRLFAVGLLLWVLTVVVTYFTQNVNLLPTIILLGSFLVPVTFVAWAFEKAHAGDIDLGRIARAFVIGGILGVLGASVLEAYLLSPSPFLYVGVGLIEELVKILALVYVARGTTHRTLRNGLLLGATVGFGFAAFETAGYAITSLITVDGLSLRALVETEILRGLLAPVGHGLWTAILGGVLFAACRNDRWRISVGVVLTYLGVSLLHALWDSTNMIAIYLTAILTASPWQQRIWDFGYIPRPTQEQVHLYTVLNWGGLIVVAALGLIWLGMLRRRVRSEAVAEEAR